MLVSISSGRQGDMACAAGLEEDIFVGSAFTVGRQDFSIRSMDPVTGKERWNVTYSRLGISGAPSIASKGKPSLATCIEPHSMTTV
jgi:hypothetical protein